MAQIDFRKKINWHRRYRSPQGVKTEHEILRIFESDRGRIINSPAIRRLQQKTQVFPLERNAAVRTRLTHSMEVQQVGRYIAKEILSRLKELKLLEAYGLDELTGPFESIVEMSCLMHDIGNPPFGHFGEAAINDWFRQRLYPEDAESQPLTDDRCSKVRVTRPVIWHGLHGYGAGVLLQRAAVRDPLHQPLVDLLRFVLDCFSSHAQQFCRFHVV